MVPTSVQGLPLRSCPQVRSRHILEPNVQMACTNSPRRSIRKPTTYTDLRITTLNCGLQTLVRTRTNSYVEFNETRHRGIDNGVWAVNLYA